MRFGSLNAPFGARCFLTPSQKTSTNRRARVLMHLLALGAFCLINITPQEALLTRLNAPFGARCFLSVEQRGVHSPREEVLMHPLALGAFCLQLVRSHPDRPVPTS